MRNDPMERLIAAFSAGSFDVQADEIFRPTNPLSELEQVLLDVIRDKGGLTEKQIVDGMSECFGHHVCGSICDISEIHQMIAHLEVLDLIVREMRNGTAIYVESI